MTKYISDGWNTVAIERDPYPESPRRAMEVDPYCDGHLVTWTRDYASPDPEPYGDPFKFVRAMLGEHFEGTGDLLGSLEGTPADVTAERAGERIRLSSERWGCFFDSEEEAGPDPSEGAFEALCRFVSETYGWSWHLLAGRMAILPIWLLDHSGVAYSTAPFASDPQQWDSGQVGFAYVTASELAAGCRERNRPFDLAAEVEGAASRLRSAVAAYQLWVDGDVYGFRAYEGNEEVDSCWGFYLDPDSKAPLADVIDVIVEEHGPQDLAHKWRENRDSLVVEGEAWEESAGIDAFLESSGLAKAARARMLEERARAFIAEVGEAADVLGFARYLAMAGA